MSAEAQKHSCKCGCGVTISRRKTFVDKEHQLRWMCDGGASEMNVLQSLDAKELGGHVAGTQSVVSGRLAAAAIKGAAKSREIAEEFRKKIAPGNTP